MPKTNKDNPQASTQSSLLISEIKDGVVVLSDGSLRAVIMASAINFDLMSQQEQSGAEMAYQGFLNSLHFPIQIVVKSQKIDLDGYIEELEKRHTSQDNQLLAMLMEDYIANVKSLLDEVNIMDKQFYIVIPFFPSVVSKAGFFSSVSNMFKSSPSITVSESEFTQYKTELTNRVQLVSSGLNQMGVRAIPLNTQELVELYYTAYNPDVAPSQKLINHADLGTASVTRGQRPTAAAQAIVTSSFASSTPAVPSAEPAPSAPYSPAAALPIEAQMPVGYPPAPAEPQPVPAESVPTVAQPIQPAPAADITNANAQVPAPTPPAEAQAPVAGQQFQPAPQPQVQPAVPIPPQTPTPTAATPIQSSPMPPNPLEDQK